MQELLQSEQVWLEFDGQIKPINIESDRKHMNIKGRSTVYGYNISDYKCSNKRKALRNVVNPEIGKYILEQSQYTGELF